ncbi:MAG: hypothetical protein PVG28_16095, partial [Desulfobacterales bacterium]
HKTCFITEPDTKRSAFDKPQNYLNIKNLTVFQSRNEQFFQWSWPHTDFSFRRTVSTLKAKIHGEHRPLEKGPLLDGKEKEEPYE